MDKKLVLVADFGDGTQVQTVDEHELANFLRMGHYGADFLLHGLYAVGEGDKLVEIQSLVVSTTPYDETDMACSTLRIVLPGGEILEAGYAIDGRA